MTKSTYVAVGPKAGRWPSVPEAGRRAALALAGALLLNWRGNPAPRFASLPVGLGLLVTERVADTNDASKPTAASPVDGIGGREAVAVTVTVTVIVAVMVADRDRVGDTPGRERPAGWAAARGDGSGTGLRRRLSCCRMHSLCHRMYKMISGFLM